MPDNIPLLQFHRQLESEITEDAGYGDAAGSGEFRENVLTGVMAEELSVSGVLESPVICHSEGGKAAASYKANGYSVPEEDSRIDLFVTLYFGPLDEPATINAADVDSAFRKLERFLGRALNGLHTELDPASDQYLMVERIHRLKGQADRVCFYLFTNARLAQRKEKERRTDVSGLSATYDVWDLERFRRLRESGTSYEPLVVDLTSQPLGGLPCVSLDQDQTSFRTLMTAFPGKLLRDLYDEYGSRLLELNVRSYLQARGKVNAGILKTLRENPQDFVAYNNGITVVAEDVTCRKLFNGSTGLCELKGMQIVNGGQTTASIHRASKDFDADLSKVFVQGKVTVVAPSHFQEVVPMISRYANTQNRVTEADLSANHPFHIGIERASKREWAPDQRSKWFYERARGSYQTAKAREGSTPAQKRLFEQQFPSNQRFTKEDLARFENAWMGLPHIVSRGGQKSFVHFMHNLAACAEGWEPSSDEYHRYVAKAILFREAQRIVRADSRITAYQINVVAYTVALLADKTGRRIDLDGIWRMQKVSTAVSKTLADWAPVVFEHLPDYAAQEKRHIGESFKQQGCWELISALDFAVPKELAEELVAVAEQSSTYGRRGKLTVSDHNNVARCMELSEKQWLAIAQWGQTTGQLNSLRRGIARTLAAYAAEGWPKKPSIKQAWHGITMIEAAQAAGIV